jgi:hypothetical protein
MHLASPTNPAHVTVSSDILKKSFSANCSGWAAQRKNFPRASGGIRQGGDHEETTRRGDHG